MSGQRVGLHVSAAGGVENAPDNAVELGAEVFQFFSRSPRGGKAPEITDEQAQAFRDKCKQHSFETYIHAPYYVNFASKKKQLASAATRIIHEELVRASQLGVKYLVTHLGSASEWDDEAEALKQVAAGLKNIYKGTPSFSTQLLLEISAGAGKVVGDRFEELAYLLKTIGRKDVHVCLDTCHMFASGYDLRDAKAVQQTMEEFRSVVGLPHLKLLHVNDSKMDLGGQRDRHEHIGKGKIGAVGFKAVLAHPDLQRVNMILETKHDAGIKPDIAFLKKHRTAK